MTYIIVQNIFAKRLIIKNRSSRYISIIKHVQLDTLNMLNTPYSLWIIFLKVGLVLKAYLYTCFHCYIFMNPNFLFIYRSEDRVSMQDRICLPRKKDV